MGRNGIREYENRGHDMVSRTSRLTIHGIIPVLFPSRPHPDPLNRGATVESQSNFSQLPNEPITMQLTWRRKTTAGKIGFQDGG